MPFILHDFYFVPNDSAKYIDKDFTYVLTLYNDDITSTFSLISYENDFESNFDALPWVPQGGSI